MVPNRSLTVPETGYDKLPVRVTNAIRAQQDASEVLIS